MKTKMKLVCIKRNELRVVCGKEVLIITGIGLSCHKEDGTLVPPQK